MSETTDPTETVDELTAEVKADRVRYGTPKALVPRRDIPKVVRQLTGRPKNPHEQTIRRWYTKGIAGVVLATYWVGGEIFTTKADLVAFFEQVTAAKARRHEVSGGTWQPVLEREPKVNLRLARMAQNRLFRRLGVDPEQIMNDTERYPPPEPDEESYEVV